MHQVRLWEITADRKLSEIPAKFASLEEWIEDWLADDISVLDPSLLVVVELKRGKTPRDVTSQALEYSSWVKDLEFEEITGIADSYPGIAGSLETAFREKFGSDLPDELNQTHRSVIVAESVDASTDRIVRYLAEMEVPINVATVQHFEDASGGELLAQVYLIEPESVQPRARRTSARSGYRTVNGLQNLAEESGIGEIYRELRDGVRGIFFAQGYKETVAYVRKLEDGGVRTVMLVDAVAGDDSGGVKFVAHATRFEQHMNVPMDDLRSWLPENTTDSDVRRWSGGSPEERESAEGLEGLFYSVEEVGEFVARLAAALERQSRTNGGEPV